MKSPLLLFALKCSVIFYFAACSGIGEYSTGVSATPIVTKGAWKIGLYAADKGKATDLSAYAFTFGPQGEIKAIRNGEEITGNWSEDNISKKITISLRTRDPALAKLNNNWNITAVTKAGVILQNTQNPAFGRLQITSL